MSGERDFWGEMGAIGREAVNDIRQTMNEVFFDHHEHGMGMGTPMNPTSQLVTEDIRPEEPQPGINQVDNMQASYDAMLHETSMQMAQEPEQGLER